jgi:hypothetical protein
MIETKIEILAEGYYSCYRMKSDSKVFFFKIPEISGAV